MSSAAPAVPADALLRRSPAAAALVLGLPLALGLASHALINLVDLLLVGRLGGPSIAAAHVASTWNFLPMIVGNCVATALLARLSRALGNGDHGAAQRLHAAGERFMLALALVVGVASALPAAPMVAATGLTGPVAADARHYLIVSNLGCVPMFALMQTTAAMRAAGEALVPLLLLLLANVLNLAFDLALMFGWEPLGIPAIGVVGAAYATVIGRTVAAVLAFAWLARRRHPLSLRGIPPGATPPVALPLLHDAWPQVLQIALRALVVLALTIVVQRRFGDSATVAIGITTRLDTLVLFAALGFANAATAYAGRAVVVGDAARARAVGLWAGLQAGLLGALVVLLLRWFAEPIAGCFLPVTPAAVRDVVVVYLGIAAWGQVFGAVALGAIGAVQGAGPMIAPLLVDAVGFAVFTAVFAPVAGHGGLGAVCAALAIGMAAVAALHLAFVAWGRWPYPRDP